MYSLMSMRTMRFSSSNSTSARALDSSVLPTPVGPRKMKLPIGRLGSDMPARDRLMAEATAWIACSWPMTRFARRSSRLTSLVTSVSIMRDTGMPVQRLTTWAISSSVTDCLSSTPPFSCDSNWSCCASTFFSSSGIAPYLSCAAFSRSPSRVAFVNSTFFSSSSLPSRAASSMTSFCLCQDSFSRSAFSFSWAISAWTSAALLGLVIGLGNQRLAFHLQNNQFAVQFVDLDGHALELHLNQRRRLVHKVDGLIGQEPVGDVACRQLGCHDQGSIRDAHAVVRLIPFLQAAQDGDRILDRRLTDQDRLEATLQRSILFDDLAILVDRRGANRPKFASRERRLQHVGGIHGSLGRARPDDRVQLVDEHDDAAIAGRNGLEHGLEPVFELATKLRTRDHRAQVECKHDLVLEHLGNVPRHDTLRKRFDDCGLADAGIADEHRVVLGPAHG